jgi:ketosteroid isomerase-like protein
MSRALLFAALPLLAACATPTPDELSVKAADEAFYQASRTLKGEAWRAATAKDGDVLGVKGPDAVGRAAAAIYADGEEELTWHPDTAEIHGTLGVTTGHYAARTRGKDGKIVTSTGTYVTVWRRQDDGSWKVVWDGGTPDP